MYVKKVAVLCNNLMMPGFNYPVQNWVVSSLNIKLLDFDPTAEY